MQRFVVLGVCLVLAGCATTSSATGGPADSRLPAMETVVKAALAQPWGVTLKQIPATVIEVGDLASVPYLSFAGTDVELNVYGDPEHPAGIEVGTKSDSPELRASLRTFIGGLLTEGDRQALAALPEGRREEKNGLAEELTLPTAPDGFGAWWVTVFHPTAMQAAKASVGELNELAQVVTDSAAGPIAVPGVGAHEGFVRYVRFRPSGPRVYATSYFKKDGAYHRRK